MVNTVRWQIDRGERSATGTINNIRFYVAHFDANEWRVMCDSLGLYKRYPAANIRVARRKAVLKLIESVEARMRSDADMLNTLRLASRTERVNNG